MVEYTGIRDWGRVKFDIYRFTGSQFNKPLMGSAFGSQQSDTVKTGL